jgi:hypothetical protein
LSLKSRRIGIKFGKRSDRAIGLRFHLGADRFLPVGNEIRNGNRCQDPSEEDEESFDNPDVYRLF